MRFLCKVRDQQVKAFTRLDGERLDFERIGRVAGDQFLVPEVRHIRENVINGEDHVRE